MVDDYPPRNRDRDGWDYLEGRGTPPPGTPAPTNIIQLPTSPPPHIATSQTILAEAGLLPPVDVTVGPTTPDGPIPDERGQALMVRLIAHRTGYGKPPKEPWER